MIGLHSATYRTRVNGLLQALLRINPLRKHPRPPVRVFYAECGGRLPYALRWNKGIYD